jgi:hypothetical protein
LFAAFRQKLQETEKDQFRCSHCGTVYEQSWLQYSAFMWVLTVRIASVGSFVDRGAAVTDTIPIALGFYGHGTEKYNDKYVQSDIQTVVSYLKERAAI